jgi:hypothetical protein
MTRNIRHICALALALGGSAAAQDPFVAGERWTFKAQSNTPWIPEDVSFAARENLALVGAGGANPSLSVLDRAAFGAQTPRFADGAFGAGASHITTVSGWGGGLFTAVQLPSPTQFLRKTLVARHDPVAAAQGAPFVPVWTHDAGFLANGPAHLAADLAGDRVVLAVWDNANSRVQVDWLNGLTGVLDKRVYVAGAALNGLEVSEDGGVVALTAGLDLYLFDGDGLQLQHEPLFAATKALTLSGDGSTFAIGGIGQLALFTRDNLGVWQNTFTTIAPSNEIAARADLSRDGNTLGLAWWNYANGVDVRFEIWDVATPTKILVLPISGKPGGPQNLPEVVEVTPDGKRVAFGTWGNGTWPEVVVFQTGIDLPLFGIDTPGSVRDLDISDRGHRVLVAYKDTHNNVFSNTGGVLLYEDGMQTISQLAPAVTGSVLPISTNLAGAGVGFLLIGERAPSTQVLGVDGLLLLDRSSLQIMVRPAVGGRSDFLMPVPADAALIGTQYSMQPAWRAFGGTILAPELVDPLIVE